MLNQQAVKELQKILADDYGKKLSSEESNKIGLQLVSFYEEILIKNQNQNHENQRIQTFSPK
jgi:hypothetical protein